VIEGTPQKRIPLRNLPRNPKKKEPFFVPRMESFPYLGGKFFGPWEGKISVPVLEIFLSLG